MVVAKVPLSNLCFWLLADTLPRNLVLHLSETWIIQSQVLHPFEIMG
jgi:hypothetical protein